MNRKTEMSSQDIEKTIYSPYEVFYIQSMLFNSESAVRSIDAFSALMRDGPNTPSSASPFHHILDELQNIVVQAASLSRYFWPVRSEHEWRGVCLRRAFVMSDESPLKSRDLRNAIEHFDERLDKYLENHIAGRILPEYVGFYSKSISPLVHLFRAYYTDTRVFELLGQRFNLDPIVAEVLRVHKLLNKMMRTGGRLI